MISEVGENMDILECTKRVFYMIGKIEPENANKILGYLLLQDHSDQEMVRLAIGPENLVHEAVYKAKVELQQLASSTKSSSSPLISPSLNSSFTPIHHVSPRIFSSPPALNVSYWDPQLANKQSSDFSPSGYSDSMFTLEDQIESISSGVSSLSMDSFYHDATRSSRHVMSLPEFPVKTCHYFNKGFCKHGSSCRYFHGQINPESFSQLYGNNVLEDHVFLPGSLEKLEAEIVELIKSRRGNPISIASLPMMYYERFGKVLQAEGYLTESQRHGKAGYSLTKLLARLRHSIRLIDRPHGQHAVILAEDAPKYLDSRSEKSDPGPIVSGSRQIYLTFPAESTFTEDDVSNYFSTFGPVEDVRIPCQQKRMFGFVTFGSSDTVKMILAKGNPHFVCTARVLVKPYREKSKLVDRRFQDRTESTFYYPSQYIDMESELHYMAREYETATRFTRQLIEEQEQTLEIEKRRLAELHLLRKPICAHSFLSHSMDELKVSEEKFDFPSTKRFNHVLDVLNSGSSSDDKLAHTDTNNYSDAESNQGLNLPESPFASSAVSVISTDV